MDRPSSPLAQGLTLVILGCFTLGAEGATTEPLGAAVEAELRAFPPEPVYLSPDRSPQEELAALHRLAERFPRHGLVGHRQALLLWHLGYREEAERTYRSVRRHAPDLEFMIFHALQRLTGQEEGGPLEAYRQAIQLDRRHPESRWALGFLSASAHRWREALDHYRQWENLQGGKPAGEITAWQAAAWYNFALAAVMEREWVLLETLLDRLEAAATTHWRVELLRGHAEARRGREEQAARRYEAARRLAPGRLEPAVYAGLAASHRKRWETALPLWAETSALDPASPRVKAHFDRSVQQALEEAKDHHRHGRSADTRRLTGMLLSLHQETEESKILQEAADQQAQRTEDRQARWGALLAMETEHPVQALKGYREEAERFPEETWLVPKIRHLEIHLRERAGHWIRQGREHEEALRPRLALEAVEEALAADPESREARALQKLIRERLEAAHTRREENERWGLAGEIAASEGRWEEAVACWKKSLEGDYYNIALREKLKKAQDRP